MCPSQANQLADQLRPAIADERVLAAIASIPRERFVPADQQERAYANVALPIGSGQTISQPSVHARYLSELRLTGHERALEIVPLASLSEHAIDVPPTPEALAE